MFLSDLELKDYYRSFDDDIVRDFYIPVLSKGVIYKRAAGFFSSTSLIEVSRGITELIKNGGKIQLLTSPHISEEDYKAIKYGYEKKEDIIKNSLYRELKEPQTPFEKERLNLLANLIIEEKLDIKLAYIENEKGLGIYHEKYGIIEDMNGNKVMFTGSINASKTALNYNYESIDIFRSWLGEERRIISKVNHFNELWNNLIPKVKSVEVKELEQEIINRYKVNDISDLNLDKKHYLIKKTEEEKWIKKPSYIKDLYDYQKEAIENWSKNGYRGIFDMATGTGKTLTSLGAISKLASNLDSKLGVVVVCPYQHLVEQWVEDIKACNVEPLICYSRYDWKRDFKSKLRNYDLGIEKNFFIITTNSTFATKYFQENIEQVKRDLCLVVDEVHNLGAKSQRKLMKDIYEYRLGVSATVERYKDEEGTKSILDFFGEKCIEYGLERAIEDDVLCRYYYYPIPITLTDHEIEQYSELSYKIARALSFSEEDELSKSAEMLLIKRSRIIAGARNKIYALKKIIKEKYLNDTHMLVYCGAASVEDFNYKEGLPEMEEKRQIDLVIDALGNDLNMNVRKFTSEENSREREEIKSDFKKGSILQALIAIRCLDEGVNIPGIKTAFILASSRNPKEYIQRRGRVLRKSDNKKYAVIYDFITLPRDISSNIDPYSIQRWEINLIKNEFERIDEFSSLAENKIDSDELKYKLQDDYRLHMNMEG